MRQNNSNHDHVLGSLFITVFATIGIFTLVQRGYPLDARFLPIIILTTVYVFVGVSAWRMVIKYPRSSFSIFYFTTQCIVTVAMNFVIESELGARIPPFWDFAIVFQAGILGKWQWLVWLLLAGTRISDSVLVQGNFSQVTTTLSIYVGFALAGHMFNRAHQAQQDLQDLAIRVEEKRQQDVHRFEQIHTVRQNFLRSATHDLKNPVNVFLGFLQLLEQDSQIQQHEQAPEYLTHMNRSANHMNMLIQDMLDLLEVQSEIQPKLTRIDLTQLIQSVVNDMAVQAKKHDVYLHVDFPSDKIHATVDPHMFRRLLDNLISNAIKYTPAMGSVTVALEEQVHTVDLHVTDTGMGIPQDEIPHIFEPFTRVAAESHRIIEGTGLGLAIVKAIADQHGASVGVDTVLGMGTTFTVRLPRAIPQKIEPATLI